MKTNVPEPKTMGGKYAKRVREIWEAHPGCELPVGDQRPYSEIMDGSMCLVMIKLGPLMVHRYADRSTLQFIFDAYGS